MKKRLLIKLALLGLPTIMAAQTTGEEPIVVRTADVGGSHPQRAVTRAEDGRQGVMATLQYVQLPDMKKARQGHQTFVYNHNLYVVGGTTTIHNPTATAERIDYTDNDPYWHGYETKSAHVGACAVKRYRGDTSPSTGYLICGGVTEDKEKTAETCAPYYLVFGTVYGFINGPTLSTPRAYAKGIYTKRKTYISGNWLGDDSTMEVLEEGATEFKPVGKTTGRSLPYMFADSLGRITVLSRIDNNGYEMDYKTFDDGSQMLQADRYDPSSDKTEDVWFPFTPQYLLMGLPVDAKSSDYTYTDNGRRISFILAKDMTQDDNIRYWLHSLDMDSRYMPRYNSFIIPTRYEPTGQYIKWRGSVIVNDDRQEVYLIGASGPEASETLHIISFNYDTENWTMASAEGFAQNLLSSSFTLLGDGRIACTGGYLNTMTDQEHARAYIFSPPAAGSTTPLSDDGDDTTSGNCVVIESKSGEKVRYLLSDKPKLWMKGQTVTVTTPQLSIDYETKQIARVYVENYVPTDINELPALNEGSLSIEAGRIVITGLQPGEAASVYQLTGALVATLKADAEGRLVISIDDMPQQASIIKTKHQSFKIIRK